MKNIKKTMIYILLFVILATSTHLVHVKIRGKVLDFIPPTDILFLPKGDYVKLIALGFDSFLADMVWLRTIQYFGGHYTYDRAYAFLDRMIDVVITLEPTYVDVYSFGAMAFSEQMKKPQKAADLLAVGIKNNPDNWHLAYEMGFVWFEEARITKDTTYKKTVIEKAIAAYTIATSRPDCPEFVSRIIPQLYYEGGWKNIASVYWSQMLEDALRKGDKYTIDIAEKKLMLMKFKEVAGPVQLAVIEYFKKFKKIPQSLNDLVKEGFITKIPLDPLEGKPLSYNNKNGRIFSPIRPEFDPL